MTDTAVNYCCPKVNHVSPSWGHHVRELLCDWPVCARVVVAHADVRRPTGARGAGRGRALSVGNDDRREERGPDQDWR